MVQSPVLVCDGEIEDMKSLLINTTGVVSLSTFLALFAPMAYAAEGQGSGHSYSGTTQQPAQQGTGYVGAPSPQQDEGFNVKMGGSFYSGFLSDADAMDFKIGKKDDGKKTKTKSSSDDRMGIFWDGKISGAGSRTLDNGMELGLGFRMTMGNGPELLRRNLPDESSSKNPIVDRYYLYLQGLWGKVTLGAQGSAGGLAGGGVPVPGFDTDFSDNGLDFGGVKISSSSAVKATYTSPLMKYDGAGLQFGMSWTPDREPKDPTYAKRDITEFGAKGTYSTDAGHKLQLGLGYSTQGKDFFPKISTEVADEDKRSQARAGIAGSVTVAAGESSEMVIGGKYTRWQANKVKSKPNAATKKDILIGAASYKMGKYKMTAKYTYAKGNNLAEKVMGKGTPGKLLEFSMPTKSIDRAMDTNAYLPGWFPRYNKRWNGELSGVEGVVRSVKVYDTPKVSDSSELYETVKKGDEYVTRFASGVKLSKEVKGAAGINSMIRKYQSKINAGAPTSLGDGAAGKVNSDVAGRIQSMVDMVTSPEAEAARRYFNGKADEYLYINQKAHTDGASGFEHGDGVAKPWSDAGDKLEAEDGLVAGTASEKLTEYNKHVHTIRKMYQAYRSIAAELGVSYEALMDPVDVDQSEEVRRLDFLRELDTSWVDNNNPAEDAVPGVEGVSSHDNTPGEYTKAIRQLQMKTKLNIMRGFKFGHLGAAEFKERVNTIIANNAAYGVRTEGNTPRMRVSMGGAMYKVAPSGVPELDAFTMGLYSEDPANYGGNKAANPLAPLTAPSYGTKDFYTAGGRKANFVEELARYQALRSISVRRSFTSPYKVTPGSSSHKPFARTHDYFEYGFGRFGMKNQHALAEGFSDVLDYDSLDTASDTTRKSEMAKEGYKGLFHCTSDYESCSAAASESWSGGEYLIHFLESGKGSYAKGTKVDKDNSGTQKYAAGHLVYNMAKYADVPSNNPLTGNMIHGPSTVRGDGTQVPEYTWGRSSMLMNAHRVDKMDTEQQAGDPSRQLSRYGLIVPEAGSDMYKFYTDRDDANDRTPDNDDGLWEGVNTGRYDENTEAFLKPSVDAAKDYDHAMESPSFWLSPAAGESMMKKGTNSPGLWPMSPYMSTKLLKNVGGGGNARADRGFTDDFVAAPRKGSGAGSAKVLYDSGDADPASGAQHVGDYEQFLDQMNAVGDSRGSYRPDQSVFKAGPDAAYRVPLSTNRNAGDRYLADAAYLRSDNTRRPIPDVVQGKGFFDGGASSGRSAAQFPEAHELEGTGGDAAGSWAAAKSAYQSLRQTAYTRDASVNSESGGMTVPTKSAPVPSHAHGYTPSGIDAAHLAGAASTQGTPSSTHPNPVSSGSPLPSQQGNTQQVPDANSEDDVKLRVLVENGTAGAVIYDRQANAKLTGFEVSLGYEVASGFDVMTGFQHWNNKEGYLDDPLKHGKDGKTSYVYVGLKYDF